MAKSASDRLETLATIKWLDNGSKSPFLTSTEKSNFRQIIELLVKALLNKTE